MRDSLNLLKEKFCAGEHSVIYEMIEIVFPDLWVHLITNTSHPKADLLGALAEKIYSQPELLCDTEEDVKTVLKNELDVLARGEKSTAKPYFESNDAEPENEEEEAEAKQKEVVATEFVIPPVHVIFQSSLDEIGKISYEIMFVQEWKQRPGSRNLLLFLVNALSFGNYPLLRSLNGHPAYFPEISNWFTGRLREKFYNEKDVVESWQGFLKSDFFVADEVLEKKFRNQNQVIKNRRLDYGKLKLDLYKKGLNDLGVYFFLIHKYMKIESLVEIWLQLNIFGLVDSDLKKDMEKMELWEEHVQIRDEGIRQESIINKYLKKKKAKVYTNRLRIIQTNIEERLGKKVNWKTYGI